MDLLNTELANRVLWYDGDSTVTATELMKAILNGKGTKGLFVSELTDDVIQYNNSVSTKSDRIGIKKDIRALSYEWCIPDEYKTLDLDNYIIQKLLDDTKGCQHGEYTKRVGRFLDELDLYKKLNLLDVLRTIIFVINTLIENNVVWGVGRGSSVASYILYLIGVHDVDSFKYGLNIEEFLRTE